MQPLIAQGAVASVAVTVTADRLRNRLDYEVSLTGRSGSLAYNRKFQLLWDQINGVDHPLGG